MVNIFFLPQILAFRTLWKPPPSSGQALSSPVQLQSPGLLLTAPGAQVIDLESPTSLKMGDNRVLLEGFVSIVLSLHIFLKPHREYILMPVLIRGDWEGNWFEDRCRVNVRDGFVRKRILPSGGVAFLPDKEGYPCRHLPERIVRQVCEGGQTCEPIWSGPNYWTLLGLVKIVKTMPNSCSMRRWAFEQ